MIPSPSSARVRLVALAAASTLSAGLFAGVVTVVPAQAADPLTVAQIQGTTATSPVVDQQVTTTPSVVTAVYGQASGDFKGFVIQTPGTGGPRRDLTRASDAVFVYLGSTAFDVEVGDAVTVTGTVKEFSGLTEIAGAVTVTELTGTYAAPRPVSGLRWAGTVSHRENLESMLWSSSEQLTVADTYPLLPYGEIGLAAGRPGELPVQPTDVAAPRTVRNAAQAARNAVISVGLDDGTGRGYQVSASYPARQLPYLTRTKTVTVGDTARLTSPVIVDFRNGHWTFEPVGPITAGHEVAAITPQRKPAAPRPSGRLRVASFNVLNFFTTVGDGRTGCRGDNLDTLGSFNVTQGCDVRGAWDAQDVGRQRAKITAAINRLDASVVGLMEIENSVKLGEPTDEALRSLVTALNRSAGRSKWAYVRSSSQLQPVADQDYITSALIYQPAEAKLVGKAYALGAESGDDGAFGNARTPIAAKFVPRRGGEPMLVVVNHFKSKGSGPSSASDPNADQQDGQGAWNAARTEAARALLAWLPPVQRAAGTKAVALVGDFNSYAAEDPIRVLVAGGYRNAAPEDEYSYSFSGLAGSLDHVLVNRAARARMTGATVWNINAGASPALEYSEYKTTAIDYYRPDPYRSSDHDPVVAGFRAR